MQHTSATRRPSSKGCAEYRHLRTIAASELDTHVPQTAQAEHDDPTTGPTSQCRRVVRLMPRTIVRMRRSSPIPLQELSKRSCSSTTMAVLNHPELTSPLGIRALYSTDHATSQYCSSPPSHAPHLAARPNHDANPPARSPL